MSSSVEKARLYFCYDGEWVKENNEWKFAYKSKHGVKLPVNFSYQKFVAYAMQKCEIDPSAVCKLVFKNGEWAPVELCNDEDISGFMHFAAESERPPLLYVYAESSVCNEDDDEGDDDGDDEGDDDADDEDLQEEQPQPQEERCAGVADDETYVFKTGDAYIDTSDTDSDDHEEYTPSNKSLSQLNEFFDMPPILSDQNTHTQTYEPVPYNRSVTLQVGQIFDSKDHLASQVGLKFLEEGFESVTPRSDKTRYVVQCARENCKWRMYAIPAGEKGGELLIRKLHDVHTCARTQLNPHHKATKRTLSAILKKKS